MWLKTQKRIQKDEWWQWKRWSGRRRWSQQWCNRTAMTMAMINSKNHGDNIYDDDGWNKNCSSGFGFPQTFGWVWTWGPLNRAADIGCLTMNNERWQWWQRMTAMMTMSNGNDECRLMMMSALRKKHWQKQKQGHLHIGQGQWQKLHHLSGWKK